MSIKKISQKDVSEFLIMNPGLFKDNPGVLKSLEIIHESGGAVSLIQKQVEALRGDYSSTLNKLIDFLENAKDNERIFLLTKEITLALIEANSIVDLVGVIEDRFVKDFDASVCKVLFFDGEMKKLPRGRLVGKELAIKSMGKLIKPNQIYSGPIDVDLKAKKFLFGNKEKIKDCVLVPLKSKSVSGILLLGSEEKGKYSPDKDTLFLEFIAEVASSLIDGHNS